jgi:hypothetical protein
LAQSYYPGGVAVDTLDKDEAVRLTSELLKRDEVVIFEGAFRFDNLFIRADIVRKKGKLLELIEVKAKSFDSTEEFAMWNKRAFKKGVYEMTASFQSYVMDLAFQTFVIKKALPEMSVRSFLMMADKSKISTVDGLNQHFKIARGQDGRTKVQVNGALKPEQLGQAILEKLDLTTEIQQIFSHVQFKFGPTFTQLVSHLAELALRGGLGESEHGVACKSCEFRVKESEGVRSGFKQCWTEKGLKPLDIDQRPMIFEIWDFRQSDQMISENIFFADQLSAEIIKLSPREDGAAGLSRTERQMVQIEHCQGLQKGEYVRAKELKQEMSVLKYPLHFIDFETNMVAIPFHKNQRPYEQMAFQFSHHMLHTDGHLEHRTEYLDDRIGVFPNFDFVRALKKALEKDDGAILRFAAHENTVLNQIRGQLLRSGEPDARELIRWIESITTPPNNQKGEWTPTRQFVDMCEMTKRLFWLPDMGGSNSIKKVLPAVLNAAGPRLKLKFPEWIQFDQKTGRIADPYKLLPPIFSDFDAAELAKVEEFLVGDGSLADGGAAMIAWARMQFTEMSLVERKALREALLRYCRLDTLAMVMIWEWWAMVCSDGAKAQSRQA